MFLGRALSFGGQSVQAYAALPSPLVGQWPTSTPGEISRAPARGSLSPALKPRTLRT